MRSSYFASAIRENTTLTAQQCMDLEDKYGAHNYAPLPVVLSRGEGTKVFDTDGKTYFDFLSASSAVNPPLR